MSYLRLTSMPLDLAAKRYLAEELSATLLDVLPDQKADRTTVQFTSYLPGDLAIAGRLVADGAVARTHLDISVPTIDEKSWFALRHRMTDVIVDALALAETERSDVTVKLNAYDPHTVAAAGKTAAEWDRDAETDDVLSTGTRNGTPWLPPTILLGFCLGAYGGFRWLRARLRDDTAVDAAPPAYDVHDEARDVMPRDAATTTQPVTPRRARSTSAEGDEVREY